MSEEQDPSPEYIKAFNNGYYMQQHEPKLLDELIKGITSSSEHFKAMKAGKDQQEREAFFKKMQQSKDMQQSKGREI